MNKVKVIVENHTGSSKRPADLCPASGILAFEDGHYGHLANFDNVYAAPVVEVAPESVKEEVAVKTPTPDRSAKSKKSKLKG